MDLNLAMRYVMVQARKEAIGSSAGAGHLFLGLLLVSRKNASDLSSDPQVQSRIENDIQTVRKLLEKNRINADDCGEKLRSLLNTAPHNAETEASNLLLQAMEVCNLQNKTEVTAAIVLELILESPTNLIGKALGIPSVDKYPKNETVFYQTGVSASVETVFDEKKIIKPQPVQQPKPQPVQQPKPQPVPQPKPQPVPQPVRQPVRQPVPQPQRPIPSPQKKRRTKINGISFRGGVAWAAIQYFFLCLVMLIAILFFMEHQWQLLSVEHPNKYVATSPFLVLLSAFILISYGIISLIRRRFQAYAEFSCFVANTVHLIFAISIRWHIQNQEVLSRSDKAGAWFFVLFFLFYSMYRLACLKNVLPGKSYQINSAMFRLKGTPAVIFFTYLMRSLIVPLIACSIIEIFDLTVNVAWKAVFSIYGFLWAWDTLRMIFKCNVLRFDRPNLTTKERKKKRKNAFLLMQHVTLFLPEFVLFLMWYFQWFPMKTWMIWLFVIYGLIWITASGSFLLSDEK